MCCIGNIFNLRMIIPYGSPPDSPKVTLLGPCPLHTERPPSLVLLGMGEAGITVFSMI